ncbi:hypothetical protein LTR17_019961 [Elasticomyces elasticus]|nr:hypothetical protein LTR17_019961 [Elasticomyces elasticus]
MVVRHFRSTLFHALWRSHCVHRHDVGETGQSIPQMIFSGVLMGVGAGFQEMGFACIMEFMPHKYRTAALGLYGTCALPCILTPLITYAFISYTPIGWRGAYWSMCVWHGFGLFCMYFLYQPPTFESLHRAESTSKRRILTELGYIGLLLFTAAATLFLVGLNLGARQYPWASAEVIAPIVYPLLPPKLSRQWRGYHVLIVVSFCIGMPYYNMQVLWPRQSSLIYASADEPIRRGVYANLTILGTWLSLISVWVVCARLGHDKWQILGFICIQTIVIHGLSTLEAPQEGKVIALVFLMSCFINQPLYLIFSMVSLNIEDQSDMGVAIGALLTFRPLGGAVATAVYSSVVNNLFTDGLPQQLKSHIVGAGFNIRNLASWLKQPWLAPAPHTQRFL